MAKKAEDLRKIIRGVVFPVRGKLDGRLEGFGRGEHRGPVSPINQVAGFIERSHLL